MADIDVTNLRKLIDDAITQWVSGTSPTNSPSASIIDENSTVTITAPNAPVEEEPEKPARTDGKRAIRTKSTGDRVYVVDDNAKTKAWVTSPEILTKLGFEMGDVEDVEDSSLLGYAMQPSIYRVDG